MRFLREIYQDNKNLAELAGQAKLLTDSENQVKQAYFETTQENKTLIIENATLKARLDTSQDRINELQAKLQEQENKKFGSWLSKL
jgi:regulator of replication initiation timing